MTTTAEDGAGVDPFRNLGRIPGLSDLLTLLQQQTEALAQLPLTSKFSVSFTCSSR